MCKLVFISHKWKTRASQDKIKKRKLEAHAILEVKAILHFLLLDHYQLWGSLFTLHSLRAVFLLLHHHPLASLDHIAGQVDWARHPVLALVQVPGAKLEEVD